MRCTKCQGLVVPGHDEARCLQCGTYWFPPDRSGTFCSQSGTCGRNAEIDGLCTIHHKLRMDQINFGKALMNRVRK